MKIRLNSQLIGAPKYSDNIRDNIKTKLTSLRVAFKTQLKENKLNSDGCCGLIVGKRFMDNDTIIGRLESTISEHKFLENPVGWIWETLFECAAADHWYEHEKKY